MAVNVITQHLPLLFALACIVGFFMAWGIGANDVANAMGTSVGSKALTFKQAVLIAAIFEAAGTILAGSTVTNTIRNGIIAPSYFSHTPMLLIYAMLAALLAAGTWLLIASIRGWPVSTTHTIIGALVGIGSVCFGPQAVEWGQFLNVFGSWIITPFIAGTLSFLLFTSVQKLILSSDEPLVNAKRYIPFYIFLAAFIISLVTLLKGLTHVGVHLSSQENFFIALSAALIAAFTGKFLLRNMQTTINRQHPHYSREVEKGFAILMIFSAASMAFAHGSNDAANAIGPLTAVVQVIRDKGVIHAQSHVPLWILFLGAAGIVIGLATYGYKVIRTIGQHITELTPSRGFAAELATSTTVILASSTGLPISTTQTLVGAILGVGIARGIAAINLRVIRNILLSWIITLPAGASLAIMYYYVLKFLIH